MKPWTAAAWRLDAEGATTTLDDGATMRLRFLSPSMARLSLRPATGWREGASESRWDGRAAVP